MVKIVATNQDDKGDVWSVKLLIDVTNTDDNTVHYLERLVNKLMVLMERNDWNFNICLVQFLAEKPLMYDSQDVLCTSWGESWVKGHCQNRLQTEFCQSHRLNFF